MSASALARLKEALTECKLLSAAAVFTTPYGGGNGTDVTVGDLRSLLKQLDDMERACTPNMLELYELTKRQLDEARRSLKVLQTPSDNERRQFIRQAAIAFASAVDGGPANTDSCGHECLMAKPDEAVGLAMQLWDELQKAGC